MLGAQHVVEHQNGAATGDDRPPQRRPLVEIGGYLLVGDPAHGQQAVECVTGAEGLSSGCVPVEIDVQLRVRVGSGQPVRGMHRQCRLAHARHAVDGPDGRDAGRGRGGQEALELSASPGEGRHVRRQVVARFPRLRPRFLRGTARLDASPRGDPDRGL
ncbi:hypothetical protein ACFQ9X_33990 [Catenulispora yoronensis]